MDSGCRILVADDTPAIHQIFREVAARARMPVTLIEASDGKACMEQLNRNDVQLAFIDHYMPGMSGIEVVWNARRAGLKTFMTLMSGQPDEELFELARQLRVYEFLVKPFRIASVQSIIRTYNHIAAPVRGLIVDGSRATRQVIRKVLAQSVFRLLLEQAHDFESARELCDTEFFDVAFLDGDLPERDELIAALKAHNPAVKVVVIANVRGRGLEGTAAVLSKPFTIGEAEAVLHQLYGLPVPRLNAGDLPMFTPKRPARLATRGKADPQGRIVRKPM
ncbi:MAG: response regulator [Xanthobacteraceae bacterium]|nr:response regulator [Xanthobacteraceae bacterium]